MPGEDRTLNPATVHPDSQGTGALKVRARATGIAPRLTEVRSPPALSSSSWKYASDAEMSNPSGVARNEIARPVIDSRRPVSRARPDHGTLSGSESGNSAMRLKSPGTTASVVRRIPPVGAMRTTGVACPPATGARALTTRETSVAVTSATIAAPLSRRAASSLFREPTPIA